MSTANVWVQIADGLDAAVARLVVRRRVWVALMWLTALAAAGLAWVDLWWWAAAAFVATLIAGGAEDYLTAVIRTLKIRSYALRFIVGASSKRADR